MIISEQEKNKIRKLHKKFSVIQEQDDVKGKEEVSKIKGISTSLLSPVTQRYLSEGITMDPYSMMMMIAGCRENNEKHPFSSLVPYNTSSVKFRKCGFQCVEPGFHAEDGKVYFSYGGSSIIFENVCKLGNSWTRWKNSLNDDYEWGTVKGDIGPALQRYLKGSYIDNGELWCETDQECRRLRKGGEKLQWAPVNKDNIHSNFKLKKI